MIGRQHSFAAFATDPASGTVPLQSSGVEATGGSTPVAVAALLLFVVAVVLATLVTYHFVRGFRRTGRRSMLLLAVGLFLLAAAPMFIRLVLSNADLVSVATRRFVVACTELSGLFTLLYVVYDP